MKFTVSSVLFIFLLLFSRSVCANSIVTYLDPVPDAKFVNIDNEIIIGLDNPVYGSRINTSLIKVTGEKSGFHSGKISLVENNTKILFQPSTPFDFDEIVRVTLTKSIKTVNGSAVKYFSFSFTTQKNKILRNSPVNLNGENEDVYHYSKAYDFPPPQSLPQLTLLASNNPTPGKIFLSNVVFDTSVVITPYLIIAENSGTPYYYKKRSFLAFDFKKQPNGFLTYYESKNSKYMEIDTSYKIIDSFYCKNGYAADIHELRVLDDGSSLLLSYDSESVDMSQIVAGGNPNAIVIGLIIQKLDRNKNVVFQWRSWDHFNIVDAIHQNLLAPKIDYVHGNALEIDNDGNIILSSRHQDEITKINISNGSLIWRLGGVHNQFTFLNDAYHFNYQHAVRRLPNGDLILFDNGNFHLPSFSRAVEYSMDTLNKTVTMVWQYRHTPDIQSPAMGFAQRLSNGNTFISWGAANPSITEVNQSGDIELELNLPNGIFSYRAFKFDWNGLPGADTIEPVYIPSSFRLGQNYPNPFNPSTNITFDISNPVHVGLFVYNELGQVVSKIVDENLAAGSYSETFYGTSLPSGIYFYRLVAGSFTGVKKMVLIK